MSPDHPVGFTGDGNPLSSSSPAVWDQLLEAVGPASLLVVINARMSDRLRQKITPEDIWQETLLHAWRDRARCQWRGLKSFRSWLLTIIDRRIRDAADREAAAKRGGGRPTVPFSALQTGSTGDSRDGLFPGPVGSTTPSRVAIHNEQAVAMKTALNTLPPDLRDVVHLRLFEQLTVEEIARRLNIGVSAVRHRFRKGAERYQRRLMTELATQSLTISQETMNAARLDSSPDR